MNPQTLKYLQKDEIGKVIATGLAQLYLNKPSKPIRYLSEWLRSYSNNQKYMMGLIKQQHQKESAKAAYHKEQESKATLENEKKTRQDQATQALHKFMDTITNCEYSEDLLEELLPEFIQKNTAATGVYIGELNYPYKEVKQTDTEELAHLDTTAQKVVNYIGSSVSHKQLMRGKLLRLNQGITGGAFSLLDESPPAAGEDGQQVPQNTKSKYVLVPDVVKNQSIHYFKIPKLGSYLAVPIICNQYLTESNFDAALKEKQEFLKQVQELQLSKKSQIEELRKEHEELEKKLSQLSEKKADETHLEPIRAQLKDIEEAIAEKQKERVQEKQPTLTPNKRSYVICADTLGQDRPFSQSQIDLIVNLANHLKDTWERKERQLLKKDVELQIKTHQELSVPFEALRQSFQLTEEEQKQLATITEQNRKLHRQLELEIPKLKALVKQNSAYARAFVQLKSLRVVKYKQLIQNILFFLRYSKKIVNSPNRTSLNWRQVRRELVNEGTFDRIFEYNPMGPKKENFESYCKTPHLLQIFDKFEEEEIFKYNIGLGAITLFIKKSLELRESDVQIRKAKLEMDRKNREKILEENQKINAKLAQDLQKHTNSLPADEATNFNQKEWRAEFYSKYPLQEVPAELIEDVDNDM